MAGFLRLKHNADGSVHETNTDSAYACHKQCDSDSMPGGLVQDAPTADSHPAHP